MKNRSDHVLTGVVPGLLGPPIAFILFCYFSLPEQSVTEAFNRYQRLNVLPHVISLSCIVNLLLFFIFLQMNKEKAARGVLGTTFFFVLVVLILKFI